MAELVCEKVKLLILLGQTKFKIRDAVMRAANYTEGNPEMIVVDTMDEAVKTAHDRAVSGDIVSLSPACASFDMYRMFEERGDHFKSLVKAL